MRTGLYFNKASENQVQSHGNIDNCSYMETVDHETVVELATTKREIN